MEGLAVQLLAPVVLALLAWPFVIWRRRVSARETSVLAATGRRTRAKVLEVWQDAEGWHITYEFRPGESKELVQRTETFETLQSRPAEVGDQLDVAFEGVPPYYSRVVSVSQGDAGAT